MGVGLPQNLLLQRFGEDLRAAFGHVAYWVGSSVREKSGWRDVDVRILLPDEEWERSFPGIDPARPSDSLAWRATCVAWATYGRELTGLPIDFQLQQRTYANTHFGKGCLRSALLVMATETVERPSTPEPPTYRVINETGIPIVANGTVSGNDVTIRLVLGQACSKYSRPEGVLGGPCLTCGLSQPEHAAANASTDDALQRIVDLVGKPTDRGRSDREKEILRAVTRLVEAKNRMVAALDEYDKAAEKFLGKVDSGRARSAETYRELKAALEGSKRVVFGEVRNAVRVE